MWTKYVAEARKKIISISDMHLPLLSLYNKLKEAYPKQDDDVAVCLGDFSELGSTEKFLELGTFLKGYFDAILPGNHEFYARNKFFRSLSQDPTLFESIPFVGLNYLCHGLPRFESHRIIGDTALIGLCNFNMNETNLLDRETTILPFAESIEKATHLTESLQKKADFFVFLTHYTYRQGLEMADWVLENTALHSDQFVVLSAHDHVVYPLTPEIDPLQPVVDTGSHFRGVGVTYIAQPGHDWSIRMSVEPLYTPKILLPWCYEEVNHIKKFQNYFLVPPLAGKLMDLLKADLAVDIVLKNAGTDRWSFTDDLEIDPYTQSAEFAMAINPFPEGMYIAELTKEQIKTILQKDADLLPAKSNLEEADFQCKNHVHPSGLTYSVHFDSAQKKYVVGDIVFNDEKPKYRVVMNTGLVSILNLKELFGFDTIVRENTYMDFEVLESVLPAKNAEQLKAELVQVGVIDQDNKIMNKYLNRYKNLQEMISDLKLNYLDQETQKLLWEAYFRPIYPPLRTYIQKWLEEHRLTPEYDEQEYRNRKTIVAGN
jgi:hypothetical protein